MDDQDSRDDWDAWDSWDDWSDPDDPDDASRPPGSSQIKTVSDPPYAQARKLDVDIGEGVVRVLEKEGISQIQVDVRDVCNRTQCYMDEFTLKVKGESGRSRSSGASRIEILTPAGYGPDKLSLDLGATECAALGIAVSRPEIDIGVDAITFSGAINGDVEIETGVGDMTLNLTGSQDRRNYQVECGTGGTDVGAEHYSMLLHETHVNSKAPYTMKLKCGVGNIAVSFDQILQIPTEKEIELWIRNYIAQV